MISSAGVEFTKSVVSFRSVAENEDLECLPLTKSFVERVARGAVYLDDASDAFLTEACTTPNGGFARLDFNPGVRVTMHPDYDWGYFLIAPRLGSLKRVDSGFVVEPVTVLKSVTYVPPDDQFQLDIPVPASCVIAWIEQDFMHKWEGYSGSGRSAHGSVREVCDQGVLRMITMWEKLSDAGPCGPDARFAEYMPTALAHALVNSCQHRDATAASEADDNTLFDRFHELVSGTLAARHTMESLADALACSPAELVAQVRNKTSMTPIRYLHRLRIESLADKLASTEQSLVALALDHGFSSQAHMSTAFRQYTGVTPRAYRASHRNALQS